MIDTLIFDFDGTLMDTNGVILRSWQHTYQALAGQDGDEEYILRTFGEPLELSLKNAFPDVPVERSIDIYRTWQQEHFSEMISLFPGVDEMLSEAESRGFKLGIATSRVKQSLYEGLEKYNLTELFNGIVTVEEVSAHKPDPECVFRVLEKLGSKPENSVMVGDSILDILCAKNAGVKAVLVAWSLSLKGMALGDFPETEAPDHIIKTPMELFDIL
ncbi:MAG: HAD family hydrolase [Lentihominibacter sp.]